MSVIDFTFWLLGLAIKRGFWQQPLLWIFRKYSYLSSHGAATYPDKRVVDGFFQNFFYMKSWSENHISIRSKWTLWDVIFHENNSIKSSYLVINNINQYLLNNCDFSLAPTLLNLICYQLYVQYLETRTTDICLLTTGMPSCVYSEKFSLIGLWTSYWFGYNASRRDLSNSRIVS